VLQLEAMMATKRITVACLLVLMLGDARSFPASGGSLHDSQLAQWHYQGVVIMAEAATGSCAIPPGDGDACRKETRFWGLARGGF
jgi:hypothetical protein